MKTFKRTVPVHVGGECWDTPDYAIIELDAASIKRIKKLARAVKDLGVAYIEEFDYRTALKTGEIGDLTDWDGRSDCDMLQVSNDDFRFKGIIKHTNVEWNTEGISLKELPRTR
jgi:hypothetical protein